jgi:hypothetical protein
MLALHPQFGKPENVAAVHRSMRRCRQVQVDVGDVIASLRAGSNVARMRAR